MIDLRQSTPGAPCPDCQQEGAWLPDISALRGANCFYCPACRKIWEAEGGTVPMMTSAPDQLDLQCASCGTALTSIHFTIGGDASDLWDRYVCDRCGAVFEYRRSMRQLKRSA